MTEKWRRNMDKAKSSAVLLTHLSKAFDCILHDFLIAKLQAYSFSYKALKIIYNCLTDRKHRTKVNDSFNDFIDCWVSLKVQFQALFYSTFTSAIFSFLWKEIMLPAMLMTQPHIQTVKLLQQF